MNWLKRLLCKHDIKHSRNIYGDEINYRDGKRSEWKCSKCGYIVYKNDLVT